MGLHLHVPGPVRTHFELLVFVQDPAASPSTLQIFRGLGENSLQSFLEDAQGACLIKIDFLKLGGSSVKKRQSFVEFWPFGGNCAQMLGTHPLSLNRN